MRLADRISAIKPSPTLEISAKAKELKKEGVNVISFGAGEPDFDTPENIKQAAIKAIEEGKTKYTPPAGIIELREAVANIYSEEYGVNFSVEEVIISCGAKHSIYNVLQVYLEDIPQGYLHVEYKGNMYWMHMKHIKVEESKHNRITEDLKRKIIKLADQLQEVLPRTCEEWEESLQQEPNPEKEMEALIYISNQYKSFSKELTYFDDKKELIKLLFECSLSTRNKMLKTFKPKYLTQKQADRAIKLYYR